MKKPELYIILLILMLFNSCRDTDPVTFSIPDTYNFANTSYTGQTQRLDKMGEITTYIKSAHTLNAPSLDATKLKDMYGDNTGQYFSTTELNDSLAKQLKNKTLYTERSNFENYMDAVATASLSTHQTASNGQAGIGSKNDNSKSYLFNERGLELAQIIEKGLMGACFYYQGTAVYMGSGKMDVDNELVNAGEGTEMEHHWDEAFGYFGVPKVFPAEDLNEAPRYWGKYCNKHELTYPLNQKMMDAFLTGRAAISAKDITLRDAQITELQKNWELVSVATALSYLNDAQANLTTDPFVAFHELSEVFGFIISLKYGAESNTITLNEVNTILNDLFGSSDPLQANNYNVTDNKIEAAKTALVSYFTDLSSVKNNL